MKANSLMLWAVTIMILFGSGVMAAVRITDTGIQTKSVNDEHHVMYYATGGTGTKADPYTGWRTGIQVVLDQENIEIVFDPGYYLCDGITTQLQYRYCLKVRDNTVIKGVGEAWLVRQNGLNMTAFIANPGITGSASDRTKNVRIENLNFDGNTNTLYGSADGTAQAVSFYQAEAYTIKDLYIKSFGRYAAVLFNGWDSIIDNIVCYNATYSAPYYYGNCLFITGSESQNNAIGKVIGDSVENVLEFEDFPAFNNVESVVAKNCGQAYVSIDGIYNTVDTIVSNGCGRAIAISQSSRNLIVNSVLSNRTGSDYGSAISIDVDQNAEMTFNNVHITDAPEGIYIADQNDYLFGNVLFKNTSIGFKLGSGASNMTVLNAQFRLVNTKVSKAGSNGNLSVMSGPSRIE